FQESRNTHKKKKSTKGQKLSKLQGKLIILPVNLLPDLDLEGHLLARLLLLLVLPPLLWGLAKNIIHLIQAHPRLILRDPRLLDKLRKVLLEELTLLRQRLLRLHPDLGKPVFLNHQLPKVMIGPLRPSEDRGVDQ